ncbi:MAG: 50S ribosomal protein L34e [Candidatus Aenigmarchaeota archaeon]|nr:50S ribosomal protein L34e [Candidatus Aenigmarchaeota archaeon]
MPRPSERSRSLRKVKRTTPGGSRTVHYKRRTKISAKCSVCNKPLHGIPRVSKSEYSNTSKSRKRPERPYGGSMCSSCMRREIKNRVLKV